MRGDVSGVRREVTGGGGAGAGAGAVDVGGVRGR